MAQDRPSSTESAGAPSLAPYRSAGRLLELLALPAALVAAPFLERGEAAMRLGMVPAGPGDGAPVWIHAASVGEVKAAGVLAGRLRAARPGTGLMVSVVTRQGMAAARRGIPEADRLTYAPLDLPECVSLALRRARPAAYVCIETELWPCMLSALMRQGVPAVVANARMSERSFRRYARFGKTMRPLLAGLAAVCAITEADRDRYLALGARPERTRVCGNLKYDQAVPPDEEEKRLRFRRELGIGGDTPVLVAGSTRSGEEEMIVAEYAGRRGQVPGLRLVIAPRHLDRVAEVEGILGRAGLRWVRFSRRHGGGAEVVLVDTMGDLAALYGIATWIFCGGSLVERGGHNIMEAAARGAPVFHGPHMQDFADAVAILDGNGAVCIDSAAALFDAIASLAPASREYRSLARAAARTAAGMQGAAARQTEMLLAALDKTEP